MSVQAITAILKPWAPWIFVVSAIMFVGTLILVPLLIVRMPADYFIRDKPARNSWRQRHPALRIGYHIIKNLLGVLFLGAGLIMLFAPGQGVLTILLGLSLLEVPGKRALEIRILRQPAVLRTINRIRARAGRRPLQLPDGVEAEQETVNA